MAVGPRQVNVIATDRVISCCDCELWRMPKGVLDVCDPSSARGIQRRIQIAKIKRRFRGIGFALPISPVRYRIYLLRLRQLSVDGCGDRRTRLKISPARPRSPKPQALHPERRWPG